MKMTGNLGLEKENILKRSNDSLLMNKNNTDKKVSQTKTRTKETLNFKLTKSMDTFPSNTPLELEDEKYVIAGVNFDGNISVLKIPIMKLTEAFLLKQTKLNYCQFFQKKKIYIRIGIKTF